MNTALTPKSKRHIWMAKLSWQLPIVGLVILFLLAAIEVEWALLGTPIFMLCSGAGAVYSVGTLWLAKKTPATRKHSITGLMIFLLTVLLLGLLCTIWNPYK